MIHLARRAGRNRPLSGLDLALVDDPGALGGLASEWDALWRSAGGRFAESSPAARAAWAHVAGPSGGRLALVTGRRDGRLALLAPMAVARHGAVRVLRPLGSDAAGTGWLVDPALVDPGAALADGWARLARCDADVAELPVVPAGSLLHAVVAAWPGARVTGTDTLAVAHPDGGQTFAQYRASLGEPSDDPAETWRRRLGRAGALDVGVLDPGDGELPGLVDWLLRHRPEPVPDRGDGSSRTGSGHRGYLLALLRDGAGPPPARLLAVRVDGEPVAAGVLGVGVSLVEWVVEASDPQYRRSELVLLEAGVEWAFGQGLGLALGAGPERYRRYWSRGRTTEVLHLQAPLGVRGRLALDGRVLARRLADGLTGT